MASRAATATSDVPTGGEPDDVTDPAWGAPGGGPGGDLGRDLSRDSGSEEVSATVGRNLKRIRVRQGLSLERLAKVAGVSRAMISQIELGRSVPTIGLLWKLAHALGVPFAALITEAGAVGTVVLRGAKAKLLTSADGSFTSRALFPFDSERRVEFYRLELAPRAEEVAVPHAAGTMENLVVSSGSVEVEVAGVRHDLRTDDAIVFEADVPHTYRNRGDLVAVMYLVMSYVETVG